MLFHHLQHLPHVLSNQKTHFGHSGSMDFFILQCSLPALSFKDTQLRFCNSEMEHAAEKSESLACRGSLKQLEIKLQATMRSEHQHLQDYHHEAESLQFFVLKSQDMVMVLFSVIPCVLFEFIISEVFFFVAWSFELSADTARGEQSLWIQVAARNALRVQFWG